MSPIKDRIASTESARDTLMAAYLQKDEGVLMDKASAIDLVVNELLYWEFPTDSMPFTRERLADAREILEVLHMAIVDASDVKARERRERWDEAERRRDKKEGLHA